MVGQDLDQIGSGLVTGGLESVLVELLDRVANAVVDLCSGESSIDSGGGLGRVAAKEA